MGSLPNDEIEIGQLEKHWTELLDKGDTTALMKSGHKFPSVKRIIENITFNQDIAIVVGKELQQPENMTTNHEEWMPRRFTNVWIKTKNGWQLAARQSSKVFTE